MTFSGNLGPREAKEKIVTTCCDFSTGKLVCQLPTLMGAA